MVIDPDPKNPSDTQKPRDALEGFIRLLFGAVLGVLAAAAIVVPFGSELGELTIPVGAMIVLGCSLAAYRYGDAFWHWITDHWLKW